MLPVTVPVLRTQFGSQSRGLAKDKIPDDMHRTLTTSFDRYLITLPTLSFPKETAKDATVSGTILPSLPHEDGVIGDDNADDPGNDTDPDDDNIRIWIVGSTTGGADEDLSRGTRFI